MAPIIHLVRHAQGYHNVSRENEMIQDPDLTPLGESQCAALRDSFPDHGKITYLAASPIRRTLHTCLLSFAPAVAAAAGKLPVVAQPDAQEVSRMPCDIGSAPADLRAEFGDRVDLSLMPADDSWTDKSLDSKYYPCPVKLAARAREVRVWLRDLVQKASSDGNDDFHVVLVTHGGILHFLTEEWDDISPGRGTGWKNTELRSYHFKDASGQDSEASLQETSESWQGRRGSEVPLTQAEQRQCLEAFKDHLAKEVERAEKAAQAAKSSNPTL